jgi:hypothetical protein
MDLTVRHNILLTLGRQLQSVAAGRVFLSISADTDFGECLTQWLQGLNLLASPQTMNVGVSSITRCKE